MATYQIQNSLTKNREELQTVESKILTLQLVVDRLSAERVESVSVASK